MRCLEVPLVACACVLLSSCAQLQGPDVATQQQRVLTELTNLQEQYGHSSRTVVEHSEALYVAPLDPRLAAQPDWYSHDVHVQATQLPVQHVLDELFGETAVHVQFAQPALAEQLISIDFEGQLGVLLERLSNQFGWYLQITPQWVSFSQWQTKEFDVAFIAGSSEYFMGNRATTTPSMRETGQSGDGLSPTLGESDQFSNFRHDQLSVWHDLERSLKLLLSDAGALSLNQSSTSVIVKDTPYHVRQVDAYLQQQNERLTRQVAIDVQILEVSFADDEQFGIDWQALAQSAGGNAILGLGSGGVGRLAEQWAGQLLWQRQQGRWSGSELFIEALQQQGLVRINNQPRVMSLNNQVAKVALQDNATYLAASGSTVTANVGTTSQLQPGVITTGFELYVLPSIRDGEVILQLSTELSDLLRIDEVRSGTQLIQTPHTNRKQFFMQAVVGDGQTLLLSGLRNEREQLTEQTSWLSLLLGGQQQRRQHRSETLVLLTPTIIQRTGEQG